MKPIPILLLGLVLLAACDFAGRQRLTAPLPARAVNLVAASAEKNSVTVIHVFVALCDNIHQGIVPVSATLGNGDDPARNLYWGAAFGVKTFFTKSKDWQLIDCRPGPDDGRAAAAAARRPG